MGQAPDDRAEQTNGDTVPGPEGIPILGVLPRFARDPIGFMARSARAYGPVVRWEFPTERGFLITGPKEVERILVTENQHYAKGRLFQQSAQPLLGEGLLTSEGELWRRQRHRIEPSFHPDRLEQYTTIMTERTEKIVNRWQDGETRDLHADMMGLTLEIVAEALLGVDIRDRTPAVREALDAITTHAEKLRTNYVPLWVPTPLNRRFHRSMDVLDEIVSDIIEDRRADPGEDVVSSLLAATDEAGDRMSTEQVHDEILTLLFAGHETTALALTYAFFALARHPEVEADLQAELDATLGNDPPAVGELPELPSTERVIKETLRLYPPVYAILREPKQDVELGGYRIPAGSTLTLSQYAVHRDPGLYSDPMAFRPDRWKTDLEANLPRFGYFPFAGGPRRCIGDRFAMLEARLILATVVSQFHLELVSSPSIRFGAGFTMRPKDPIQVRVHAR
jgi:cytochrome P450